MYWSYLIHLGFSMWDDVESSPSVNKNPYRLRSDVLRHDRATWDAITNRMATIGMNQVVIDIGEGLRFDSHPELAADGAWTPTEMAEEVARLKSLGLQAIPKLNFSAAHDAWLGDYAFMVSSKPYRRVCADLIAEAAEIFGNPELFHIGMDEETLDHQRHFAQVVIRNADLWYSDLQWYVDAVERVGSRAWMWSDRIWHHEQEYLRRTPQSILQSNWYYGTQFDFDDSGDRMAVRVRAYDLLEKAGFDQVPCASNWSSDESLRGTVQYGREVIDPCRLKGFLMAPWFPTVAAAQDRLFAAVDQVGDVISHPSPTD